MNLNIGGKERKEGWKVLNIQPGDFVDYVGDISSLEQFPDETFDKVYASHVLEHVRQRDVVNTLTGIRRTLKTNGQFFVSVPDWDILCHLFINPIASLDVKWHALRMILGGQVDEFDFHYVGFRASLKIPPFGQNSSD